VLRIVDRYMIRTFVRAFLVCFFSLVSLYIVIDASCNMDEFCERASTFPSLLAVMGEFYGYRLSLLFDRMASMVTSLSVCFTLTWMKRNNELTPLFAAGVSTSRLVAPLLACGVVVIALTAANQELIMPRIAGELQLGQGDDDRELTRTLGKFDRNGILMDGVLCVRAEQSIRPANVTLPPQMTGQLLVLAAREAKYIPPESDDQTGGWILHGVVPDPGQIDSILEPLGHGTYFFHSSITFEEMARPRRWVDFQNSVSLVQDLQDPSNPSHTIIALRLHARLTRPLASMIMILLGLPFVVGTIERRMFSLMGVSLFIALSFRAFAIACERFCEWEYLSPVLAAWLPSVVFGGMVAGMLVPIDSMGSLLRVATASLRIQRAPRRRLRAAFFRAA
jgi:lipopolysaccharide export system permease protein